MSYRARQRLPTRRGTGAEAQLRPAVRRVVYPEDRSLRERIGLVCTHLLRGALSGLSSNLHIASKARLNVAKLRKAIGAASEDLPMARFRHAMVQRQYLVSR